MVFAGKSWQIDCDNPINYDYPKDSTKQAYFCETAVTESRLCVKVRENLYKIVKLPAE